MSQRELIHVTSSLSLDQAERIITGARAHAREHGLLPLAIAVIDSGAQLVAYQREDGCGTARFQIARGKAEAALGMGSSGRMLRDRLKERVAFQAALAAATDGRFVAVPGGVLVRGDNGQAIGAIGISGDTSDADEAAAIAGIQAAGFTPYPATPSDTWKSASL